VLFPSPKTDAERNETASACVRKLGIRIPALRDGIANATERSYTGWPDRLYLIGRGGRVLFKSKPGPFGFEPKGLESALRSSVLTAEKRSERRFRGENLLSASFSVFSVALR
jgi:hypothetical protein